MRWDFCWCRAAVCVLVGTGGIGLYCGCRGGVCVSCWKLFLVCFLGWLWLWRVVVLEAEAVHSTIILLYVMLN